MIVMIESIMHNYYEINIYNKNGQLIKSGRAFNKADSSIFLQTGYISKLRLIGDGREKFIEPYPNIIGMENTDYFSRISAPYREGNLYYANYSTKVDFPSESSSGRITGFQLTDNTGNIISSAELTDIEGDKIALTYTERDSIIVTVYLFFVSAIPSVNPNAKQRQLEKKDINPIQYFQPSNSILCGCCGNDFNLLEIVDRLNHLIGQLKPGSETERYTKKDLEAHTIDGYLPFVTNKYIAFTKSPMPPYDDDFNILLGGINNYTLLSNAGLSTDERYKNAMVPLKLKGLITGIVFPGLGAIDLLSKDAINGGPLRQGILKGSQVNLENVNSNETFCYVPDKYIDYDNSVELPNDFSAISIEKNAFYKADIIEVRRWEFADGAKQIVSMMVFGDPKSNHPSCEAFFSDKIADKRKRRCQSFSQHIPLTNYYCGAETVIPCSYGYNISSPNEYYGYDIVYRSNSTIIGEEEIFEHYIAASYIVLGEVALKSETSEETKVFQCTLEYSYNGNDFFEAFSTDENTQPYTRIDFDNTIAAPIWKLSSPLSSLHLFQSNSTTYSDPYISDLCNTKKDGKKIPKYYSGYDPLFIFIGFDNSKTVIAEDENAQAAEAAAEAGREINGNFSYPDSMAATKFYTKVPYLYQENDSIFFCGELSGGYRKEPRKEV